MPYDFDMSALVWPTYARLNPDFKQRRFSDRYTILKFEKEEDLWAMVDKFQSFKDHYLTCFNECPYLDKKSKKQMKSYIASFYRPLKDKKKLKETFL